MSQNQIIFYKRDFVLLNGVLLNGYYFTLPELDFERLRLGGFCGTGFAISGLAGGFPDSQISGGGPLP